MDRTIAIHAVMATLDEALDAVERAAAMARDEVASEETKPEGKYDTRATEASYLARGQAWRVAALRRLRAWFDTLDPNRAPEVITVGSLVSLSGPRAGWVFVAPDSGPRVVVDGEHLRVISPASPLGQAMADLEAGDAFEVNSPQGLAHYTVVALH